MMKPLRTLRTLREAIKVFLCDLRVLRGYKLFFLEVTNVKN